LIVNYLCFISEIKFDSLKNCRYSVRESRHDIFSSSHTTTNKIVNSLLVCRFYFVFMGLLLLLLLSLLLLLLWSLYCCCSVTSNIPGGILTNGFKEGKHLANSRGLLSFSFNSCGFMMKELCSKKSLEINL